MTITTNAERADAGKSLPTGRIGKLRISKLICGGNLINGFAHDRDLIYVSDLMRHYFTDEKIMETWQLCEENGINTMISTVNSPYANGNDPTLRVINKYRNERGGRIQWIAQCFPQSNDLTGRIKLAIDNGAVGAFIQGEIGDRWVKYGRVDLLAKAVSFIKEKGLIAGVAGHDIAVPIALKKEGVDVDFYMKTLHKDNYWSVTPKEDRPASGLPGNDNMWCIQPEKTIEFMRQVKKPWIAYKVLAAGAIHPREGFRYAFEGGADFICAGMLDFQIVEDVLIARDILAGISDRQNRSIADLDMELTLVEAGTFQMGSAESGPNDEKPVHNVTISRDYWMGTHEVTQVQWRVLMGNNPSYFKGDELPVEQVSWEDAINFCRKLTQRERAAGRMPAGYLYRLPTEAEWEYAARGGSRSRGFKYAGSDNPDEVAQYWKNWNQSYAVGGKQPNELGLYDMSGNVWEWCLDWYAPDYYSRSPQTDPLNRDYGEKIYRVCRGGSWGLYPTHCRSANRGGGTPGGKFYSFGFRVVLAHSLDRFGDYMKKKAAS
jgi:formylglycine-generating enzyme required for sulfatase activity